MSLSPPAVTERLARLERDGVINCFIMRLHVRDVEHLEELIDRFVPYGQTTTSIVQSSPVPRRAVSLD